MDWLHKNLFIQWFLSGVLLGIGFVFPSLWPLGIVGGAYFLYLSKKEQVKKSLFLGAWLAWTIKSLLVLQWVWSTYPVDWLPAEIGSIQLWLIGGYWIITSISIGLGAVLVAFFLKYGRKTFKNYTVWSLLVPFVWVIGEVFGSVVFSLVTIGPGGSINSDFSFGYVGYLLAENQWLLAIAKIAGVYSLSFVFITFSLLLLHLLQRSLLKLKITLVTVLLLLVSAMSFLKVAAIQKEAVSENKTYSIVTIDTNFSVLKMKSVEGRDEISKELNQAMSFALEEEPDYIILPEDTRFFDQKKDVYLMKLFFQFQYQNPETVIVDTGRVETANGAVLQTFIYNGFDGSVDQVHKRYLVPQGEFISSLLSLTLRMFGYGSVLERVNRDLSYIVGSQTSQVGLSDKAPGVLFCFESTTPTGVRTLIKERPELPFVAHPISHAWFHEPYALWQQFDTMLKVQAVWNQKYIISAGGHVEGKLTTPFGKVESMAIVAEDELWRVRKTEITVVHEGQLQR